MQGPIVTEGIILSFFFLHIDCFLGALTYSESHETWQKNQCGENLHILLFSQVGRAKWLHMAP